MPTLLMKCPQCGKRFEVERTADKVETKEVPVAVNNNAQELVRDDLGPDLLPRDLPIEGLGEMADSDEETVVAKEVTHNETFRCRHCGYTWSENRSKLKT